MSKFIIKPNANVGEQNAQILFKAWDAISGLLNKKLNYKKNNDLIWPEFVKEFRKLGYTSYNKYAATFFSMKLDDYLEPGKYNESKETKIKNIKKLVEQIQNLAGKKVVFREKVEIKILTESFKTWLKEANVFDGIPEQFRKKIRSEMGGENSQVETLPFGISNIKKVKPIMDAEDTIAIIAKDQNDEVAFVVAKSFGDDKFVLYIGKNYRQKYSEVKPDYATSGAGNSGIESSGRFVDKTYDNSAWARKTKRYYKSVYELRISAISSAVERIAHETPVKLVVFQKDKNRMNMRKQRNASNNQDDVYKGGISAGTIKKYLTQKFNANIANDMEKFRSELKAASENLDIENLGEKLKKLTALYQELRPKMQELNSIEFKSKNYAGTKIFDILKSNWAHDKERLRNLLKTGNEYK